MCNPPPPRNFSSSVYLTKVRELEHFLHTDSKNKLKLIVQFQLYCKVFVVILVAGTTLKYSAFKVNYFCIVIQLGVET